MKDGRKEGSQEGRLLKEVRAEGLKEGRREGRKVIERRREGH